jgi:biopolymer transport protein ExbB
MLRGLSLFTPASNWPRILMLFLTVGLVAATVSTAMAPSSVYAQAEGEGEAKTGEATEPAPPTKNFLTWMIEASGIFGFVLLLMSFVMVALIMMNILQVRRDNLLPPAFIESFEQRLAQKDYQGAYEAAKADDSFVARVLAAGLSKLNRGYDEAIEGMQEVGEDENMALEHRLSYLALIGTVAPMIGLMGTVWGMIASFKVIAESPGQPKPSELADGISTALFTTIEGLAVAIPAMIFYSLLRNRVARYVLEVGMISEGLMSRFSTMGKKPAGGGAPQAAPAAKQE